MSVVEIVEKTARENGATKATSVTLDIGELSGVMPDAVEFCYEAATKGTLLEGSRLIINRIAARARCGECGEEFKPEQKFVVCPKCEAYGAEIIAGEELAVRATEIEK